ncbi:MAG TPA: AI-2E family transporter [Candidatus Gracilibacteria bacterium]|nr:AI-2E family transporter [Candidatus Gracilibacteria bacterium]
MASRKKSTVTKKSFLGGFFSRVTGFRQKMAAMKNRKKASFDMALVPKVMNEGKVAVDLTPMSVAKSAAMVVFTLVLFYFLYDIRGVLLVLFVSFLLAAAFDPIIDRFSHMGVPRALSILLVYLLVFVLSGMFVTNVVTLVAEQVVDMAQGVGQFITSWGPDSFQGLPFAKELQPYIDQMFTTIDVQSAASQLQSALQILSAQLLSISLGLFNVIIVLILTFFMTIEEKSIEDFFRSLFPSKYGEYISTRMSAVKDQIGLWLRGQVLVSIAATILSYVGLVLMGVDYALTLSLISGIAMLIPVFGRFFAWIVTLPIVLNQSPSLALWVSVYYFILVQIENNILVPYIMNKAVGLSPIIIIFAMMVGQQYLGIPGLVLSIPVATTVSIFVRDYTSLEK